MDITEVAMQALELGHLPLYYQGFLDLVGTTLGAHQTEMDYQAANITIPQGQPTYADTPGLFDLSMSETFVTSQTVIIGAVALAAVMLLK